MKNVAVMAPIWNYHPVLVDSIIAQTVNNWELFLVHDGPTKYKFLRNMQDMMPDYKDKIHYTETDIRIQEFGHPLRKQWMEKMRTGEIAKDCDYLVMTNADNYHCPPFMAALLHPLVHKKNVVAAYCSHMTHNYWGWSQIKCELIPGHIDIAAIMFRKQEACEVGWNEVHHSADWSFIDEMIKKHGPDSFYEVAGNLVVHN